MHAFESTGAGIPLAATDFNSSPRAFDKPGPDAAMPAMESERSVLTDTRETVSVPVSP
jgi:hypothetical protein